MRTHQQSPEVRCIRIRFRALVWRLLVALAQNPFTESLTGGIRAGQSLSGLIDFEPASPAPAIRLDTVGRTAVPEPEAGALMVACLGLYALGTATRRRRFRSLTRARLLLPLTLSWASLVRADTLVYNQPAVSPVQRILIAEAFTSGTVSDIFVPFDNFTLSDNATIDTVQWQGAYVDGRPAGSTGSPEATQFLINFYSDSDGEPGTILDPPNIVRASPSEAHETLVGSIPDFSDPDDFIFGPLPVTIYDYQVTLSTPVHLLAGQQYWLGIVAFMPDNAEFDWFRTVGQGPDNFSWQVSNLGMLSLNFDTTFSLSGTTDVSSVPEPRPWALLGTSLILILAFRRIVSSSRLRRQALQRSAEA